MARIVAIVEGHGEVAAVPVLLRRIAAELAPGLALQFPPPIRRPSSRLLKPGELEKDLQLALDTAAPGGAVLVLLDSEDALPCIAGPPLLQRVAAFRPGSPIFLSLAYREFETWFIAAADSLAGRRNLSADLTRPISAEFPRDAKGWLTDRMIGSAIYKETADQAALASLFDMSLARQHSLSFARFWRICGEMFASITARS